MSDEIDQEWLDLFKLIPKGYDPVATAEDGMYFDPDKANRGLKFFELFLTHNKGELAGKPFVLAPWQKAITACIYGWMREDGTRRYREAFIYVPRKNGKVLDDSTPIFTPKGWKTHGELKVGDMVPHPSGLFTPVVHVHPPSDGDYYELTFSNGEKIVAHANHEWVMKDIWRDREVLVETKMVADNYLLPTTRDHKEHRYRLAVCKPLELPSKEYTVHPYVLGAWLGDGTSTSGSITCGDPELNDYILSIGEKLLSERKYPGKAPIYTYDGLSARLKGLGLRGNKHIPESYMLGSVQQRLELLRGLMDTDGHCTPRGQCEFTNTNTNRTLATQVRSLASSLGYKTTMVTHRARLNGADCGPKYRVCFTGLKSMRPFNLQRKCKHLKDELGRGKNLSVVRVSKAEGSGRCITVQAEDGLYCAGETFVTTHNSTWCAGFALGGLVLDEEQGAEVYSVAGDAEQASLVFEQAKQMVERDPTLSKMIKPYRSSLTHAESNSFYKYLTSKASTKHGGNTHVGIIDEVHAMEKPELIEVIETSTGSRTQPLLIYITTADYARPSKCNELRDYALDIIKGVTKDSSFLPVLYEADLEDDWTDPEVWAKANPNLGVSVKLDFIAKHCERAKNLPSFENTFKRLYLNVQTEQDIRWLPLHLYDECPAVAPSEEQLRDSLCWGGIDLASTCDLTAFAMYWPEYNYLKVQCWLPEEKYRTKRNQERYGEWVRDGWVCITPGSAVDYQWVRASVVEASETYRLQDIGYDPWNATQFALQLQDEDGLPMVQFRQGFASMNEPSKAFERMIVERKLNHGGNPALRWMVSNVCKKEDPAGNLKPDKSTSSQKIDGVVASIIAIGRSMFGEETSSVYETRGILSI